MLKFSPFNILTLISLNCELDRAVCLLVGWIAVIDMIGDVTAKYAVEYRRICAFLNDPFSKKFGLVSYCLRNPSIWHI
jgi:hypothetical protein